MKYTQSEQFLISSIVPGIDMWTVSNSSVTKCKVKSLPYIHKYVDSYFIDIEYGSICDVVKRSISLQDHNFPRRNGYSHHGLFFTEYSATCHARDNANVEKPKEIVSNSVTVNYSVERNVSTSITKAEYALVESLMRTGNYADAIKASGFIVEQYELTLVDARALCYQIGRVGALKI